ncbi:MAG TPA: alpha/beta hydrolase [Woeseiaceae bacterium]|nr:alpha/beta hydrolase [Woeseiaceae bacterium]
MNRPETARYYRSSDGLQLFYHDFAPDRPGTPVICLPGLTRNSRDFDELAAHLSAMRRVLTPDLRGRGFSDHDPEWRNYHPGTYVRDVWTLLDALGIDAVIVIGTSLGGLIAMAMAAQDASRLAGVVMNDIGPEVAIEGLQRIQTYTGKLPPVANWDEARAQTREIYGAWLPGLSDAEWDKMTWRAYRAGADGVPVQDMDRNIGRAVREVGPQVGDPWMLFDGLRDTPTLLLHGVMSDILTPAIIDKMRARKPDLQVVDVPDRGHAPLLSEAECIAAIDNFVRGL